jgi:RHS repeat-associated protein
MVQGADERDMRIVGRGINPQGTTDNHYKFTGKERDAESGLDYFGARYYASSMGRFMSPDWSAKEEPVPVHRQNAIGVGNRLDF